jgi:hypothetical protein
MGSEVCHPDDPNISATHRQRERDQQENIEPILVEMVPASVA